MPLMSWPILEVKTATRAGAEAGILASFTGMTLSNWAFSLTVCEKKTIGRKWATKGNKTETWNSSMGWFETNNPLKAAGWRIEPPVSEPRDKRIFALEATEAAGTTRRSTQAPCCGPKHF